MVIITGPLTFSAKWETMWNFSSALKAYYYPWGWSQYEAETGNYTEHGALHIVGILLKDSKFVDRMKVPVNHAGVFKLK